MLEPDTPIRNPFLNRGPIRDPARFVGRKAELRAVLDLLEAGTCVSVVGERRIGKSSLLVQLPHAAPPELLNRFRFAYLDLGGIENPAQFYEHLCLELGGTGQTRADLVRLAGTEPAVLCLDEFDSIALPESFTEGFFSGLRSLASSGQVLFVLASYRSLDELCRRESIRESTFWNLFQRVDLGLLTPQEIGEYTAPRVQTTGLEVPPHDMDAIQEWVGGHPFFLELALYAWCEAQRGGESDWETRLLGDLYPHLCYLWIHQSPAEQAALRWAAGYGTALPEAPVLHELVRRGLLLVDPSNRLTGHQPFARALQTLLRTPPATDSSRLGGLTNWLRNIRTVKTPLLEVESGGAGKGE